MNKLENKEYCSYWFVKIFYLGNNYFGIQKQPKLKTIEGELIRVLEERNYIPKNDNGQSVKIAGRTDKGVHARGMVFSILSLRDKIYPMELNKYLPEDIIVWETAFIYGTKDIIKIKEDYIESNSLKISEENNLNLIREAIYQKFHPRYNVLMREYRYYLFSDISLDNIKIDLTIKKLTGTHDFKNFCKNEEHRKTLRTIDSIDYEKMNNLYVFKFRALSFLWKQIRKFMYVLFNIASGNWEIGILDKLLDPNDSTLKNKIEPFSANNLILWNIEYPNEIIFETCEKCIQLLKKRLDNQISIIYLLSGVKNSL